MYFYKNSCKEHDHHCPYSEWILVEISTRGEIKKYGQRLICHREGKCIWDEARDEGVTP